MSKNDKKNKLARAIIILIVIVMLVPILSVLFSFF